ncbi:hypothetical protein D3C81_2102150 [compost metagenome]
MPRPAKPLPMMAMSQVTSVPRPAGRSTGAFIRGVPVGALAAPAGGGSLATPLIVTLVDVIIGSACGPGQSDGLKNCSIFGGFPAS